jgi:Arrestin (or S-antigen), C-terminal domain
MKCKAASLWCHDLGDIKARAWTDRTGYVAGQTILFSAKVENRSGKRITQGSSVRLVQKITFHARGETKTKKETLFVLKRGPFSETETWDRVRIPIPANAPAKLQHCKNIEIDYRVKVGT